MQTLKEKAQKAWGQVTPEQRVWITRALFLMGCGFLWKVAQNTWPSIEVTLIGLAIFSGNVVCVIKLLQYTPKFQGMRKLCVPAFIGSILNFVVVLANRGFMPWETSVGMYSPIGNTNLAYLGDWVLGWISPGDTLLIVTGVGIIVTLIRKREHKLAEQS